MKQTKKLITFLKEEVKKEKENIYKTYIDIGKDFKGEFPKEVYQEKLSSFNRLDELLDQGAEDTGLDYFHSELLEERQTDTYCGGFLTGLIWYDDDTKRCYKL